MSKNKYIQGKDGKFAGSIGEGRDNTPKAAPSSRKVTAPSGQTVVIDYGMFTADERDIEDHYLTDGVFQVDVPQSAVASSPSANTLLISGDSDAFREVKDALVAQAIAQHQEDVASQYSTDTRAFLRERTATTVAPTPVVSSGPLAATGHPFTFHAVNGQLKPGEQITDEDVTDFLTNRSPHIDNLRDLAIATHLTKPKLRAQEYTFNTQMLENEILENDALTVPVRDQALALVYSKGLRNIPTEWVPTEGLTPSREVRDLYAGVDTDWLSPFQDWVKKHS